MKHLWIILMTVIFASCGTNTGNPDLALKTEAPISDVGANALIGVEVCSLGARCGRKNLDACKREILEVPGIPDALGAPVGLYPTLRELERGLARGEVGMDAPSDASCREALRAVDCGDAVVTEVFGDGTRPPERVDHLLNNKPDCGRVIR